MSETLTRVLVVDDNVEALAFFERILKECGFQVTSASNGQEALKRAQEYNGDFQVAVIDQRMGPPDGVQVMQELHRYYPWLETIILTGWKELEPGERAMELGAYRYMSKPEGDSEELVFNVRMAARFGREKRLKEALAVLNSASSRLGTARDEAELYQALCELTGKLLPVLDGFILARWDPLNRIVSFPFCQLEGVQESWGEHVIDPAHRGITDYVIETGESLLLADGDRIFREMKGLTPPRTGRYAVSKLVVPMSWQGTPIGTITALCHRKGVQYSFDHLAILQAIANQAAAALQSIAQQQEASQLARAVEQLIRQVATDQVQRSIVEQAHALIESDFTGLILHDSDGTLRRGRTVIPEECDSLFLEPRNEGGLSRWVIQHRRSRVIPETDRDPLVKPEVCENGIGAMLVMPLIFEGYVLGVLYAHRLRRYNWSDHDLKLWSAFAALAAAKLYTVQAQEQHINEAEQLADELGLLGGRMSLAECLSQVAGAARRLFGADACRITEVDPATHQIVDWTLSPDLPEDYRLLEPPRAQGLTAKVIATHTPVFRAGASLPGEPPERPELLASGLRAHAAVPLVHRERVIAVLHVLYFRTDHVFSVEERSRMQAFSNAAALALDRARHDSLHERWNRLGERLDSLEDPNSVLSCLMAEALTLLRADDAILLSQQRPSNAAPSAVTWDVLCRSDNTRWSEMPDMEMLRPWIEGDDDMPIVNHLPVIADGAPRALLGLRLDLAPSAPDQHTMLVLRFADTTELRTSDLAGLRQACRTAANAIRRLWLMTEIEESFQKRDRQLHAVATILEASRKGESTEALLHHVADAFVETLGCDLSTLLEYEPGSGRFLARATKGLLDEKTEPTVDDIQEYLHWFVGTSGPLYIPDASLDPRLMHSAFVQREGIKSMVIYRLRVDNDVFGLLFVNYRKTLAAKNIDIGTMRIWADLAASLIRSSRLQERIQSHTILVWMSMLEDSWRHALVQKGAAVRNYALVVQTHLDSIKAPPPIRRSIKSSLLEIDRLAQEIADAPVRVPQSWEVQSERIPIKPLLEESARRVSRSAELQQLERPALVDCALSPLEGVEVVGYRRWLIYALEALLQNACRRSSDASRRQISTRLTGEMVGSWAVVYIQDNGPGVPETVREHLFREPLPPGASRSGMGVGAFLAANIIREHGGHIWLQDTGPQGTTVALQLPAVQVVTP
jgi:GAF domain-containing protein/ActR/RegA family two-component response regulator